MTMGLKAQLEPKGLHASSRLRPDLLLTLPGRHILTDVAVVHSLAPGAVKSRHSTKPLGNAKDMEATKRRNCAQLSSQRQYELLPFAVETTGSFAPSAVKLMQAMALAAAHRRCCCGRGQPSSSSWWAQSPSLCSAAVRCPGWRGTIASVSGMFRVSKCRVEVMDGEDEEE